MADLDRELVERVARWCAEAGRTAGAAEIRAALERLGWDELLAARALLADPPPARPLGPYALADLARGAPPDLAAEREQSGRYPRGPAPTPAEQAAAATPPEAARPLPAKKGARRPKRATVVVRKPAPPPAPPPPAPGLPLLDELLLPHGRAELELLLRKHGAVRPRILAALTASHRRADGAPLSDADLDALLTHHGQARAFQRRERDALLHALRAAGGVRARTAAALGYAPEALPEVLARAGATAEAEKLRETKRRELRTRGATLSDKVRMVVADPEKLEDLGLLAEFEADLKARLPAHLAALARGGEPLTLALASSVSMPVGPVHDLATRLGLSLGGAGGRSALPGSRPLAPAVRGGPGERPSRGDRPPRADRPGGARPFAPRPGGSRPSGDRPAGRPPIGDRPPRGDRPGGGKSFGARPPRGDRPGGGKPFVDRPPRGDRPGGGKPFGDRPPRAGRPAGGPPSGDRPPRRDRPAGDRPALSRPAAPGARTARPAAPRSAPPSGGRPFGRPPDRAGGGSRPPAAGRPSGAARPAGPGAAGRGRPPPRGPGSGARPAGRGPRPGGRGPARPRS